MRPLALLLAGLTGFAFVGCEAAEYDQDAVQADAVPTAALEPLATDQTGVAMVDDLPSEELSQAKAAMDSSDTPSPAADPMSSTDNPDHEIATFGAGCFWCVEAVLEQQEGVVDVTSGYMGGEVDNPTYKQVCTGTTGHAEVVQVTFDPEVLPYPALVDLFWRLHDPTTLNQQGADRGTQYRSAIYYHSDAQRQIAEASKLEAQDAFRDPIVTEITAASTYYLAEVDHQDYYRLNSSAGYCRAVIAPKLKKLGLEY